MRVLFALAMILISGKVVLHAQERTDADHAAIESAINSYVQAFNQGDAEALAKHWSEQGEFISPAGERAQGHDQLAAQFAAYFESAKGASLELIDTTIEFQSPSVALETGIARVLVPDQDPSETKYKAVHVKTTAGWKIDSVEESDLPAPPPSHYEELKQLSWLVGEWGDTDDVVQIETKCRWTSNQNFLVQTFKVYVDETVEFEGTQIIGWDPAAETVRSWMFDSDGGFGAGRWSGEGKEWTVQTLSVLPDGRRGSATQKYEVLDDDTIQFRSFGRQVDGELMPSIGPVKIVRKAQE